MSVPAVEFRQVFKQYPDSRYPVLAGIDLAVAPGDSVAVAGRSGSGKSTLLNLAGTLDAPSAGEVLVAGASLDGLDETARALLRRARIGFVFQFFNLIPTLTVGENLRLPLELNGVGRVEARRRGARWLKAVGLTQVAGRFPENLSGGEQQRVAVARALVHVPALVLADEPTGNLDADTAAEVLALLVASCRDSGSTLLIATHSGEAAAACDRVLFLDHGQLLTSPP